MARDYRHHREGRLAQIEAAVRSIGSRYPYDDIEHQEVTLRGNHDQVGAELRQELIARLAVAGFDWRDITGDAVLSEFLI